jgi:hypothetical protein
MTMINSANTTVIKTTTDINELRRETQKIQKNGAPFMLASVILWALIAVVRILPITLYTQNLLTFCCSMLLIPFAFIFSKIIGADIFKKTENPINKLGFLCTMNQMLYLLIVMWAFSQNPEVMVMLFAMVFGGHLLPYSWVYSSKTYLVMSIVLTLGSLIVFNVFGAFVMCIFVTVCQIITSTLLLVECRKNEAKSRTAGL